MASHHHHPLLLLVSILLPLSLLITPSQSCGITVYWGQKAEGSLQADEGSLRAACDSNFFKYVTVSFLITFGRGQAPVLDLQGKNCNGSTCADIANDIVFCQSKGIKVLLSLGGTTGTYGLSSRSDANAVAAYLWNNFLSGAPGGPLGTTALDGIDFHLDYPSSSLYWDSLARAVNDYSNPQRKIYLSAAPYCRFPDPNLADAINTGLFDFVWVKFYDNSECDYSGGVGNMMASWNKWSSAVPVTTKLFLGLPASPKAAGSGYIDFASLSNVLTMVKNSKNYGGVMLWNRGNDVNGSYTASISSDVCSHTGVKSPLLISQVI